MSSPRGLGHRIFNFFGSTSCEALKATEATCFHGRASVLASLSVSQAARSCKKSDSVQGSSVMAVAVASLRKRRLEWRGVEKLEWVSDRDAVTCLKT